MASRIRGQEATIQIIVDGEPKSWTRVNDFTGSPRQELTDEEYLGQATSDIDFRHDGFDFSFSMNMEDSSPIDFLEQIANGENLHLPYPNIQVNVIYAFRDGQTQTMVSYYEAFLKIGEESIGGRTDFVTVSVEGKAKQRNVFQIA